MSKHSTNFILEKKPKLLIANIYKKSTIGREERVNAIMSLLDKHKIEYKIVKI